MIHTSAALVLAVTLLGVTPLANDDDVTSSGMGWICEHLDLQVSVEPESGRIDVAATARVRLALEESDGPSFAVNTRRPAMEFISADAGDAIDVELNARLPDRPSIRLAHVRADQPFHRGDEIEVSFRLANTGSTQASRSGSAQQIIVGPLGAIASWVEAWYPIPLPRIDQGEGMSARASAAPGTTDFVLPAGWRALSNGARTSREETANGVRESWTTEVPTSRSFSTAPYRETVHEADGREVRMLLTSDLAEDEARERVTALAAALAAMEERFGPYPYPSYGIAEVPAAVINYGWGASSEQGFIMASTDFIQVPGGNLPLFAHEAAHGWWGNKVGSTGDGSILLSESLAQYGAVIAIERVEGAEAATKFLRSSRAGYVPDQCAEGYFILLRNGRDRPLAGLESGGTSHTLADAKGHWMYHMLRRRVGDDVFFATLRGFIERADDDTLSVDGMREAFGSAAPDADLERFFADWLDRTGAPVLDVAWEPGKGGDVVVQIDQVQEGGPFGLWLDVAVDGTEGTRLWRVPLTDSVHRVTLAAAGTPTGVRLDPHDALLIWKKQYGLRPPTIDVEDAEVVDVEPVEVVE
jgi:hypothetical protein